MNDDAYTGDTQHRLPRADIAGCALVQDLIPLFIDGEVSPESHVLIAEHLQRCQHCSGFLAGARSVRKEILDEQSTIRAAFASAPAVAAVQQPLWSSPLATLWRFAMLFVWLGALALTFMGVVDGVPEGMLIGGFGTLAAIGGLMIAGGDRRPEWRLGMLLTGLLGVFCAASAVLGLFHYHLQAPVLLGGIVQLAIATWGLWPHRSRAVGQPGAEQAGSGQPMLAALLSLAGAALSAGMLLAGIVMLGESQAGLIAAPAPAFWSAQEHSPIGVDPTAVPLAPQALPGLPELPAKAFVAPAAPPLPPPVQVALAGAPAGPPLLLGVVLVGAGIGGLLVIAGRRGWLPSELRSLSPRRWIGYGLASVSLLWLSFVLRALLVGLVPSLPSLGVSVALLLLGWALARRPPPEEQRVV